MCAKRTNLHIRNYNQISIDGDRATHYLIKVLAHKYAYDKSLANVDAIAHHTHCTLRFNYTHENLKPEAIINDLKEIMPGGHV